jgi:hypothetical protein
MLVALSSFAALLISAPAWATAGVLLFGGLCAALVAIVDEDVRASVAAGLRGPARRKRISPAGASTLSSSGNH